MPDFGLLLNLKWYHYLAILICLLFFLKLLIMLLRGDLQASRRERKFARTDERQVTMRGLRRKKERSKHPIVVRLSVKGLILTDKGGMPRGLSGVTFGTQFLEQCEQIAALRSVQGIIVTFSTPGGTLPGSDLVYQGLVKLRDSGKIVIAYIHDLSASGGVYSMVGADLIFMPPTGLTGSIGVLGPMIARYERVKEIGGGLFGQSVSAESMKFRHLHEGAGKTFLSPFGNDDPKIEKQWEKMLGRAYCHFVAHVASSRMGVTEERLRELGAAIVDATTARQLGLVDQIGYMSDVREHMAMLLKTAVSTLRFMSLTTADSRLQELLGFQLRPQEHLSAIDAAKLVQIELSSHPVMAVAPFSYWLR